MKARLEIEMEQLALGRLYFKAVDFEQAISRLETSLEESKKVGQWRTYSDSLAILLRIYADRMEFGKVKFLCDRLFELSCENPILKTAKVMYTLGICHSYQGQICEARECFAKSLYLAGEELDSVGDSLHAEYGLASCLTMEKNWTEALSKLNGLKARKELSRYPDLEMSVGLLENVCHRELGDLMQALSIVQEVKLKASAQQNLYMVINALYHTGMIFKKQKDFERALATFYLLKDLISERDLKHCFQQVNEQIEATFMEKSSRTLIKIKEGRRTTLEVPNKGEIRIGQKWILLELLKIFGLSKGEVLLKEDIARKLWNEDYNPLVHDNKIYVTIKRLRQLLEEDERNPVVILHAPGGYRFSSGAELVVETVM